MNRTISLEVPLGELIAIAKALNVVLEFPGEMVRKGEMGFYEVLQAVNCFDDLADIVTAELGSDSWIEDIGE